MILMNDFKAEPPELREAMLAAARRVIESGWYVLGSESSRFEKQWADICGAGQGVGVANGLDAIEIALRALGVGPGDEVITTPMTAFASVLAVMRAGATPVLADIEPETGILSRESVTRCISSSTRAIVLVHLYGQVRDMPEWKMLADSHGIHLVEDCAQAHLASQKGTVAGSFGIAGAYSFYPTKNLGAVGDAGMLVTSDEELASRARKLRNYGQSERYHHPVVGMNSRLDEIQSAMLAERLKWLPDFTERRRQIADAYRQGIQNPLVRHLAVAQERSAHVYHLYVVLAEARDALLAHLAENGVQSLIHYPVPAHLQIPCRNLRRDPRGLEFSERHARSCLSLPCHPQMSRQAVQAVIDAANSFKGE